jgi:dihydrofolate reductase
LIGRRADGTVEAMRKLVMQMMTTLDGRVDDPDAWMTGVSDDLYAEIDRLYESYDAILVGRATALEMAEYWPGAEEGGTASSRSVARKMNAYTKYVFTSSSEPLAWSNVELVTVDGDEAVRAFVEELKARPGADIHLSGGARLAKTLVRLGLVDRYLLFVHPVLSGGASWFDEIGERRDLTLESATAYSDGIVGLYYA